MPMKVPGLTVTTPSDLEIVMTGGMDNPVDVVFTSGVSGQFGEPRCADGADLFARARPLGYREGCGARPSTAGTGGATMQTQPTSASVPDFLAAVPDERRRADARQICALLTEVTGEPAVMWGDSIVGFGSRTLRYPDGRETPWMLVGFSARKAATVLYLAEGFEQHAELLGRLGPHSIGKSCLYLKRLADVRAQLPDDIPFEEIRLVVAVLRRG